MRSAVGVVIFGHALCEKALEPYIGLTAHALLVALDQPLVSAASHSTHELDVLVAERLRDEGSFNGPRSLTPLPVLGVPGWWPANEHADFYDNARYFRPGRARP
jgi:hypothetical protein